MCSSSLDTTEWSQHICVQVSTRYHATVPGTSTATDWSKEERKELLVLNRIRIFPVRELILFE